LNTANYRAFVRMICSVENLYLFIDAAPQEGKIHRKY